MWNGWSCSWHPAVRSGHLCAYWPPRHWTLWQRSLAFRPFLVPMEIISLGLIRISNHAEHKAFLTARIANAERNAVFYWILCKMSLIHYWTPGLRSWPTGTSSGMLATLRHEQFGQRNFLNAGGVGQKVCEGCHEMRNLDLWYFLGFKRLGT